MAKQLSPSKRSFNNFVGSTCHKKIRDFFRKKNPSKKNVPRNKKGKVNLPWWFTHDWQVGLSLALDSKTWNKDWSKIVPLGCPAGLAQSVETMDSNLLYRGSILGENMLAHVVVSCRHDWWCEHVCTSDHSWVWSCRHEWCLLCGHVGVNDDSRIRSYLFIKIHLPQRTLTVCHGSAAGHKEEPPCQKDVYQDASGAQAGTAQGPASPETGCPTAERGLPCGVSGREKGGEEEPEAGSQGQEGGREEALFPGRRELPDLGQNQGRRDEVAEGCHLHESVQFLFFEGIRRWWAGL